jgi:hypothetical protein
MADSSNDPRIIYFFFYGMIVIVGFLTIFSIMGKAADGDGFNEQLIANDLALGADLILGASGDVELVYNLNKSDKEINIAFLDPCTFGANIEGTSVYSGALAFCADDIGLTKEYFDYSSASRIVIEKKDGEFSVWGDDTV